MRFTPGPWENSNGNIYADDVFVGMTMGVPIGNSLANADLMAAGPDMYEALRNLENDDNKIPEHAWNMVQDAIKKADGK